MALQLASRKDKLQEAGTDYEKAVKRLHVSAIPDSLPCREEEFAELYSQLASAIQDGSGFCICRK
jgi:Cdc6-like AAA superfamily ATPase